MRKSLLSGKELINIISLKEILTNDTEHVAGTKTPQKI